MTTDDRRLSESILEQFKVEINALSATPHADKIKINVLTMIAEDFGSSMNITNNNNQSVNSTSNKNKSVRTQPSDLGKKFYSAIRELLLMDKSYTSSKYIYKLPLVYLIDSMLKNIIGDSQKAYNTMVAADAHIWIRKVSQDCTIEKDKMKLRRVLSTWRDMELFPVEKLDRMGQCFVDEDTKAAKLEREAALRNQVSERQKANAALNKNMQNLLEDMRRGMPDAADLTLDKLMEINPSLYETIKATAQEMIDQMNNTDDDSFNFFYPLSKETGWEQLCVNQNVNDEVQRGIDVMNRQVRVSVDALSANGLVDVSSDDTPLVDLLVASSTASKYITNMLKIFDDTSEYEVRAKRMKFLQRQESTSLQNVDITLFTTEGVKKKSLWPINSLYSEGLPYASSSDGRRFATQIQLSRHLDYIFQKRYIAIAVQVIKRIFLIFSLNILVKKKNPVLRPRSEAGIEVQMIG